MILEFLLERNDDFLCNFIFVTLALYLLAATIKGNSTLGFRFASPTFYPMRSNETQMNSFVFNVLILNACSLGITQFCCQQMPSYTKKTFIFQMTIYVRYSDFMFKITENDLVGKTSLFLSVLTIIFNICKGGYRLKF